MGKTISKIITTLEEKNIYSTITSANLAQQNTVFMEQGYWDCDYRATPLSSVSALLAYQIPVSVVLPQK